MTALTSKPRRSTLKALAALGFSPSLATGLAHASRYPAGPVTLMVPYPAGGPADVSARILSGPLGDALGVQVIVENLGGATGTIAASRVLNGPADGSMIFQGTQNELILPPLTNPAVRYQSDAFECLQQTTVTHTVLLTRSDLPVKSVAEFLALAKSRGATQPLTYGSVGVGSLYHLVTDYLSKVIGATLTHIPYKGSAPVMQDLLGKQIDFSIMPFQAVMQEQIKAGRFNLLAVLSRNKPRMLAHIPSLTDTAGLENFEYASYTAYFVKRGTPEPIKAALNQATGRALQNQVVIDRLEADGRDVLPAMSLADAAAAYEREISKYKEVLRVTGYVQA